MDYIANNKESYEKVYTEGWGNRYPDTKLITIYYNKIQPLLQKVWAKNGDTNKTVLDFGCSLGANMKFFESIGFDVYGIDISHNAIERCIKQNGFDPKKVVAADILRGDKAIKDIFDCKFDLIIASECLYYFSDKHIVELCRQFEKSMKKEGFLYASMGTYNHESYRGYKNCCREDGLTAVEETGSLKETLYVNIVEDKEDLEKKLDLFDKQCILRSVLELDSENESLHFIGKKRN